MRKIIPFLIAFIFAFLGVAAFFNSANAGNNLQDDQLAHGKYLATLAGCTSCHTPDKAEYQNPQTLTLDQIKTIAFSGGDALDNEKFLAGGRLFDLGPAGKVFTRNLTPHEETGIGKWTDDQVKIAIKTGLTADGSTLFPVMPYHVYNGMADADLEAVIAFVRSVNAVNNKVPDKTVNTEGMPTIPYTTGIIAPDATDKGARGAYLVNSVMGCTDCHTPVDPATGAPIMDKYLAGRQPYEGPWGIVYGGNITPDEKTGIGSWSNEEVKRALVAGISKDGRRLILMPWYAYTVLTKEDADAVVYFLKNGLPAVDNEIPAPSLNPEFNVVVENEKGSKKIPVTTWAIAGLIVILFGALGVFFLRRKTINQ